MAVAIVAASATVQQDLLSSVTDSEIGTKQIELVRRKSRDRIGTLSSDEFEQELVAIPVKSTHVVADWQCSNCSKKLILEMKLAANEDLEHNETDPIVPATTWKNKLWLTMEVTASTVPPYAIMSRVVSGVGLLFILISIINFVIETSPRYHDKTPTELFIIESICIAYFTVELALRVISCPSLYDFVFDKYTVIDVLSILPYYISLGVGKGAAKGLLIIRILRLMRVFRVFKVSKYNEAVNVVVGSLRNSTEGLYLMLFLVLISTILFSSAMYFVERESLSFDAEGRFWYAYRTNSEGVVVKMKSPFQSIIHSAWWCLVTLTTVGYGDDVPFSTAGRFVAAATMLCGILVIAFPMVIIGQNFQDTYQQYRKRKRERKRRKKGIHGKKIRRNASLGGPSSEPSPGIPQQGIVIPEINLSMPVDGAPTRIAQVPQRSNSTVVVTPRGGVGSLTPVRIPRKRSSLLSHIDADSDQQSARTSRSPVSYRSDKRPQNVDRVCLTLINKNKMYFFLYPI